MSQDVRFIEITFENLEYITIPAPYFYDFQLTDIQTSVRRAAANAILKYSIANTVIFELKAEANKDAVTFEGDFNFVNAEDDGLFQRLHARDITHIDLIYADKSREQFSIVWEDDGDDEYHNRLQSAFLNAEGRLCVKIGHGIR